MQIILFRIGLNKLLRLLWQTGVVCRPQPLCDKNYLFFPSLIFPLPSDASYAISPRASVNTACGFTFIYISFSLALLSVVLGQGNEAKFCPGTRNAAAVPAVWLQPDEAGQNSDLYAQGRSQARQRPCLGLGVFDPWSWSAQGAGRAQAGASGPLHEPTGSQVYCNPSYKAGTLGLPCTVKCCMLFVSLQYSAKFLNHS